MTQRIELVLLVASVNIALAQSLYIVFSAGVFSVATVSFAGIGAYTAAILSPHTGIAVAMATAVVFAAVAALIAGPWLLRLDGIYLAMATLAANAAVVVLLDNMDSVTGGVNGLFGLVVQVSWAVAVPITLAMGVLIWLAVDMSRLGLRFRVVRTDRALAAASGVSVASTRLLAFVISAAVAGLGGAMFGLAYPFLSPDQFSFSLLVLFLTYVVVGGLGSVFAPMVTGLILAIASEWLRFTGQYEDIIYGGILIAGFLLMPRGVASRWTWAPLWRRVRRRAPGAEEEQRDAAVRTQAMRTLREAAASTHLAPLLGTTVLRVEDMDKAFLGVHAVRDVSLSVAGGEVLGIIGPNGAGKSTLISLITGQQRSDAGSAHLRNARLIPGKPHHNARLGVRLVFQGSHVVPILGPTQNVEVGRRGRWYERCPGALEAPLEVANLSYGTRRWLEIARSVLTPAALYIFDEPTAGLTPSDVSEFRVVARQLADAGAAVIVVEHDLSLIGSLCDRIVAMDRGRVIAEGTSEQVFATEEVVTAYLGVQHAAVSP